MAGPVSHQRLHFRVSYFDIAALLGVVELRNRPRKGPVEPADSRGKAARSVGSGDRSPARVHGWPGRHFEARKTVSPSPQQVHCCPADDGRPDCRARSPTRVGRETRIAPATRARVVGVGRTRQTLERDAIQWTQPILQATLGAKLAA